MADLSVHSKHTVGKRIAANTSVLVLAKALGAVLGLFTLIIARHALGDVAALGIVVFVHSYMLFFAEVATFQSWQSLIRFGTEDIQRDDVKGFSSLIRFGILIDFISAILAFIGAIALFGAIVWFVETFPQLGIGESAGDVPLRDLRGYVFAYCILVLFKQTGTAIGIFRLFDKFKVLAVRALVLPVVRLIGSIIAALMGWGIEGFLLVWFVASLLGYVFLPIMAFIEVRKRDLLANIRRAKADFFKPREGLWPFVWKSNIDSTLAACTTDLPPLMVMTVFGPAFVAIYKIAEEISKLLSEGVKLVDQVIYPELARIMAAGRAGEIWRLVTRAGLISLGVGCAVALFVWAVGPFVIVSSLGEEFRFSVTLAVLLVIAAAIFAAVAPLFPAFYAADKPEQAIYARVAGLAVYILAFFALSLTIGELGPGIAPILGNLVMVILVTFLLKRTLNKVVKNMGAVPNASNQSTEVAVRFAGKSDKKIWGLPVLEWQSRAFKKAGTVPNNTATSGLTVAVNWVLSSALAAALVKKDKSALVQEGTIVAINGMDFASAEHFVGQPLKSADLAGLTVAYPEDLAGTYNKALRKNEPPYALNIETTPIKEILSRQFASSYKGITDFVTKFVWPVPAFYATRFCAALRITPNMVTTLSLAMVFAAMYYFAQGQWALGIACGWFMTFLDTVDGKLARTTMTYSKWGNVYDHGIDLIHPPFWYIAMYWGLGGRFEQLDLMTWAIIIVFIGYILDRLIEGLFIAQHGFHIHVWRPFNSGLRFVTARRNPNLFIFMIGIMASVAIPTAALWGFYAVVIWTWVCIFINIGVVIVAMLSRKPVVSWMNS